VGKASGSTAASLPPAARLLRPGDVAYTVHSNLRAAHAVLHLVSLPTFSSKHAHAALDRMSTPALAAAAAAAAAASAATAAPGEAGEDRVGSHCAVLTGLQDALLAADYHSVACVGVPLALAGHTDYIDRAVAPAVDVLAAAQAAATQAAAAAGGSIGAGARGAGAALVSSAVASAAAAGEPVVAETVAQGEVVMRAVKHALTLLATTTSAASRTLREVRFLVPLSAAAARGTKGLEAARQGAGAPGGAEVEPEPQWDSVRRLPLVRQTAAAFENVWGSA
jgi:hypothetical protein